MSCNPAIGGIAKGHLVREIDALGGIMGEAADKTGIQFRLLNSSRGPAVQAPRCQSDKHKYSNEIRRILESQQELSLHEAEVAGLVVENGESDGCGVSGWTQDSIAHCDFNDRDFPEWTYSHWGPKLSGRAHGRIGLRFRSRSV